MKHEHQLSFKMRSHGGSREGAGRKKRGVDTIPHAARETVDARTPVHINFKLIRQAPCLRTPEFMRAFTRILFNAQMKGLRVQQFAIESNHIHLVAEANHNRALSRGMMSLKVSITWALRKIFMFHGNVFTERYHIHLLKTPTEMRNALRYVLFNHAKHTGTALFADEYSSVYAFESATALANIRMGAQPSWFEGIRRNLSEARSWMQNQGWKRAKG